MEMQCAEGCSVETTWHLDKDLQVKKTNMQLFKPMETEKNNAFPPM